MLRTPEYYSKDANSLVFGGNRHRLMVALGYWRPAGAVVVIRVKLDVPVFFGGGGVVIARQDTKCGAEFFLLASSLVSFA